MSLVARGLGSPGGTLASGGLGRSSGGLVLIPRFLVANLSGGASLYATLSFVPREITNLSSAGDPDRIGFRPVSAVASFRSRRAGSSRLSRR
jgi:hypothetical protein